MKDQSAPRPGCDCAVCKWANAKLEAQRRQEEDLETNYQRYLAGELVSRDSRE